MDIFVELSERVCIYLVQSDMVELTSDFLEDFMFSYSFRSMLLNLLMRHNNHRRQKLLLI